MKVITIVMPFYNEGEEPVATIKDIYKTAPTELFDIIAIDDFSDQETSFPKQFSEVKLIRNSKRMGNQYCRDLGVQMAKTPYILIIDAHMRFPTRNWLTKALDIMSSEDKTFFCTTSINFSYGSLYKKLFPARKYGATINFNGLSTNKPLFYQIIEAKWITKKPRNKIQTIPCLLGANYFFHKEYYQSIKGLQGLKMWGTTEPHLSLKIYRSGGNCKLIRDITIAHKYRERAPYTTPSFYNIYNKLFTARLLLPAEMQTEVFNLLNDESTSFLAAMSLYQNSMSEIQALENHLNPMFTKSISDFLQEFNISYAPISTLDDQF